MSTGKLKYYNGCWHLLIWEPATLYGTSTLVSLVVPNHIIVQVRTTGVATDAICSYRLKERFAHIFKSQVGHNSSGSVRIDFKRSEKGIQWEIAGDRYADYTPNRRKLHTKVEFLSFIK